MPKENEPLAPRHIGVSGRPVVRIVRDGPWLYISKDGTLILAGKPTIKALAQMFREHFYVDVDVPQEE